MRELVSLVKGLSLLRSEERPLCISDLPSSMRYAVGGESNLLMHNESSSAQRGDRWFYNNHDSEEIRRLICAALNVCNGHRSAAARELGIARSTLYRKMEELGID